MQKRFRNWKSLHEIQKIDFSQRL